MNPFSGHRGLRVKRDCGAGQCFIFFIFRRFSTSDASLNCRELNYNWNDSRVHGTSAMARPALPVVNLVFVTLMAAPFPAACADWYIGASAGQSRIDASADEIEQAFLIDDDFVASGTTLDETDVGWKACIGYRLFSMLAIEAGYADLGEAAFTTSIVDAPPPLDAITPFSLEGTATADGPQLSALLDVPLFGSFSAFARAGAMRWTAEFSEFIPDTGTTRVARTEDEIDALYGAGFQLKFSALAARLEWERIENVGEGIGGREGRDVDFVSAGVVFNF